MKPTPERSTAPEAPFKNRHLVRVWRFFALDVWQVDLARLPRPKAWLYKLCRITYLATSGFLEDDCAFRASALTYITVLSIVPLLAFAFSVLKGLGSYEKFMGKIQTWLDSTLQGSDTAAGSDQLRNAIKQILEFVNQTDASKLGAVGLAVLMLTAVQMLSTVERSLNDIWGVQKSRRWPRKIADYLAMMIIVPVFFATAISLTSMSETETVATYMREQLHLGGVLQFLIDCTSIVAMWIGFTFCYLALPNARTKFSSALLGGIFAAVLWHLAQIAHAKFQIGLARYNKLYASFAAIPILLAWIQVSWITVLAGAELAFAHQSEPHYQRIARSHRSDHAFKEVIALRAMVRIAAAFVSGERRLAAADIADELDIPQRPVEEVLGALRQRGIVVATEGAEPHFLPGRDLAEITVKHVLDALKGTSGPVDVPARGAMDAELDRLVAGIDGELTTSRYNKSLRELALEAAHPPHTARAPRPRASDVLN
jgi:membrane protein